MRKITDVCPFCSKETLSDEGDFMIDAEDKDVKICFDFICENCCEEWTVWETYSLVGKKRWYSKYIEVEEDMLNNIKECTCDECCGESEIAEDEAEISTEAEDAIEVNLKVGLDKEKLKKAVDTIVDEAFGKAGKAVETFTGTWSDFSKVWEDLWLEPSKKEESFKITCMTNDEIERKIPRGSFEAFNAVTNTWDDLWRKPAKKINPKGGHPQDK